MNLITDAVGSLGRVFVDAGRVLDVLGAGLAASELLRQKRDKLADEDFSPSGPARFLVKDLTFATDSAAGRLGGGGETNA